MFGVDVSSLSTPLNSTTSPLFNHPHLTDYILVPYVGVTVLLGIICNGVVIHGSVFRSVFSQDRVSRIVSRELAITDLLITLTLHIPVLITVICRGWVLGSVVCGVTHQLHQLLVTNKLWLMVLISAYRVWMVRQPTSVRDIAQKKPWVTICGGVLLVSCTVVVILEGVSPGDNAFFDPHRLSCYSRNFYEKKALYSLLVLTPFYLAPIIMTLELLIQLLIVIIVQARAARTRDAELLSERQRRRLLVGSVLRILVVVAHCLPLISMFADYVHYGRSRHWDLSDGPGSRQYRVLQALGSTYVLLPLNCTSPLINLAVNQQFRSYLSEMSEETIGRAHGAVGRIARANDAMGRIGQAHDATGRKKRKSHSRFYFPFQRLHQVETVISENVQSDPGEVVSKL